MLKSRALLRKRTKGLCGGSKCLWDQSLGSRPWRALQTCCLALILLLLLMMLWAQAKSVGDHGGLLLLKPWRRLMNKKLRESKSWW